MEFDENGIKKPKKRGPRGGRKAKELRGGFIGGFVSHDSTKGYPIVQVIPPKSQPAKINQDGLEERLASPAPKERKVALSCLGIPSSMLEAGDPAYARTMRLASSYKKARQKEIYIAHGYVSSGVASLLVSASLAISASRFLYEAAAASPIYTEVRHQLGMPQLMKLASSLADSARQNELAAWELAARESLVRKRNENSNVLAPWVVSVDGETRKPGRPKKVSLLPETTYTGQTWEEVKDARINLGTDGSSSKSGSDAPEGQHGPSLGGDG